MAHPHREDVHLCAVIVLRIGLGQQLTHPCKKAAGLIVIGVCRRDRHQAAQPQILSGGSGLQQGEQAVGLHAALARFLTDVDLHKDVLHQPQTGGSGVDLVQQPRAVHALDQGGAAHDLVDLVGLQMADKMPRLAVVGTGIGFLDQFLHMVLAKEVDRQLGAAAHLLDRAGLAGGAELYLCGVAAGSSGGRSHCLADMGNGFGHLLLLCLRDHRTSS